MPAPPKRPVRPVFMFRRLLGQIDASNRLSRDLIVRLENPVALFYIMSHRNTVVPDVEIGQKVVLIDKRKVGRGIRQCSQSIDRARIFKMISSGCEPVVYIMVGPDASQSVPVEQKIAQNHRIRTLCRGPEKADVPPASRPELKVVRNG